MASSPEHDAREIAARTALVGRLCVIGAALLWSTNGLFAKNEVFNSWPDEVRGTLLSFWRNLFAGLVVLPFVRRIEWRASMAPMAVCFTCLTISFLQSMVTTTAANAIWLQSIAPVWVFLFSRVIVREAFDRRDLVPLVLGALGVGVILAFELRASGGGVLPIGVALGMASGVFYACVILLMRHLRTLDAAWLVAFNHLAAAAMLAPYIVSKQIWPSGVQWLVVMAFGAVQMGIPYLLFAEGLRRISSQESAGLSLLEPVLVPLWVFAAYGEEPAWWTIAGGGLILLGLALRYLGRRNPRDADAVIHPPVVTSESESA